MKYANFAGGWVKRIMADSKDTGKRKVGFEAGSDHGYRYGFHWSNLNRGALSCC